MEEGKVREIRERIEVVKKMREEERIRKRKQKEKERGTREDERRKE